MQRIGDTHERQMVIWPRHQVHRPGIAPERTVSELIVLVSTSRQPDIDEITAALAYPGEDRIGLVLRDIDTIHDRRSVGRLNESGRHNPDIAASNEFERKLCRCFLLRAAIGGGARFIEKREGT